MYKLKNDGVEDKARDEKHDDPSEEKRGTPGFNIARTTWILYARFNTSCQK